STDLPCRSREVVECRGGRGAEKQGISERLSNRRMGHAMTPVTLVCEKAIPGAFRRQLAEREAERAGQVQNCHVGEAQQTYTKGAGGLRRRQVRSAKGSPELRVADHCRCGQGAETPRNGAKSGAAARPRQAVTRRNLFT